MDQEVSILGQKGAWVELLGGLPSLRIEKHRGQVGQDHGTLQREAGVAPGVSADQAPSPDSGLK